MWFFMSDFLNFSKFELGNHIEASLEQYMNSYTTKSNLRNRSKIVLKLFFSRANDIHIPKFHSRQIFVMKQLANGLSDFLINFPR